jgi:hypothetical protein
MSRALRWAANLAAGGAVLVALALGLAWLGDRSRRWETPAWSDRSFVALRAGAVRREREVRWVMAVNLRCPHCLVTLGRTHAAWTERGWQPALAVLVVDTPERLEPAALRGIPTAQVWWDSRGIWRRRWGHRIYGEILQFDRSGRHVRTVTADDILRRSRLPGPDAANAPADRPREGG